jgi:hypothetical protein
LQQLEKDYSNLSDLLAVYEDALTDVEKNLRIKGKTLQEANVENPTWQSYYDERRVELHTLVKYFDAQVQKTRGKLFKGYTENYSYDISDRAKDKYIDHETAYLNVYELFLEIKELYEKYESVVDAFRSRGFALNNITKLRVASLEDSTI